MNYEKPKSKQDKGAKPPISANFAPPPTEKVELLPPQEQAKPKARLK